MRFKDVFAIIGPSMIGPSSSHTAGAARLGRTARQTLGTQPAEADISLYGSFAETYRGHGTDLALVAGLLDYDTDDERIRDAYRHAEEAGLSVRFHAESKPAEHPNTVTLRLSNGENKVTVTGRSIGGGNIEVTGIDAFDIKFTATDPTLLVFHRDRPGMIAEMTDLLRRDDINISRMELDRVSRSGEAITVIECDQPFAEPTVAAIAAVQDVRKVRVIDLSRNGRSQGGQAGV